MYAPGVSKALVTGGCGFLGSWIVRELLAAGRQVRVLALPGEPRENLEGVDVEIVDGDVCKLTDCRRAVAGCREVFHTAAIYTDWAPNPTRMYDVNLRGTFNVLEAARQEGVRHVIYTASMVSIGRPREGELGDEGTPYEAWEVDFHYSRSKFFSRELAEYFGDWGFDVRVVCPGIILGPNDVRPTPSGQLIINSVKGGPAAYFKGGASYVDVRDAARVHVLAADKGRRGERYLATAHNLSNREIIESIDRIVGRSRKLIKLPVPVARALVAGMEARASKTGTPPLLSRHFFEYSLKSSYYSNEKARSELGATFRPFADTVRDAVAYFRARNLL